MFFYTLAGKVFTFLMAKVFKLNKKKKSDILEFKVNSDKMWLFFSSFAALNAWNFSILSELTPNMLSCLIL